MARAKKKQKSESAQFSGFFSNIFSIVWKSLVFLGSIMIRPTGRLVLVSAVILFTGFSFANYAKGLDQFMVGTSDIQIVNRPVWMSEAIELDIKNHAKMPDKFSIFSPRLAEDIAAYYENFPWVREVLEVRKEYPNKIHVKFSLRKPAAVVETGSRAYYVDEHGVRLDAKFYNADLLNVMRIVGETSEVPKTGLAWNSEKIDAGLEVMAVFQKEGLLEELSIDSIDVSHVGGGLVDRYSDIVLTRGLGTPAELRIEWGRSSEFSGYGRLSDEEKIANLRAAMQQVAGLQGIRLVNLRNEDLAYVR